MNVIVSPVSNSMRKKKQNKTKKKKKKKKMKEINNVREIKVCNRKSYEKKLARQLLYTRFYVNKT
jgi:hypothetical protein